MSHLAKLMKAEVLRIIFIQILVVVGLIIVMILASGAYKGLSFAAGAFSYVLPTLLFMLRVSAQAGARAISRFMIVFLAGEMIKLMLCSILFIIAIKYLHLDLFFALIGLILAIIAFWIASVMVLFQVRVKL